MSGALLALLVALAPGTLPLGTARYAMTLGGEPVGLIELSLRCDGPACLASWESRQRMPEEAGGAIRARRVVVPVDRRGLARGPARVSEGGRTRDVVLPKGKVPAMLVEVALGDAGGAAGPPSAEGPRGDEGAGGLFAGAPGGADETAGPQTCLEAVDELTGRPLTACARREGEWLEMLAGRQAARVRVRPGRFPSEIQVPSQGVRFRLDPNASLPSAAPRLYGSALPGPADPRDAFAFCGRSLDPEPAPDAAAGLPAAVGAGPTCRERTADWLGRVREAGLRGRTAVGAAWDGGGFVWHAWGEVLVAGRWVPVDPSFRQAPARGPRFTLATYEDGDEGARRDAGLKIVGCWGRGAVTGKP